MEDEIERCPYCLKPIQDKPIQAKMTPRQWRIYNAIVSAGPEGMAADRLLFEYMPECKAGTLRTCIHSINALINPRCLRGRGGRYYLDRVNWSEEPIDILDHSIQESEKEE